MIYLLWPTVRPEVFLLTHRQWLESADDDSRIRTVVAVNSTADERRLSGFTTLVVPVTLPGVCLPSFRLCQWLKDEAGVRNIRESDIVILSSDDFFPPPAWDTYVIEKLHGVNAALYVRDGYHDPGSPTGNAPPCITLPIMTFGCLRSLNYIIYHPDYVHMESDIELYENLLELDLLIDDRTSDQTTFTHRHFITGHRPRDHWDDAWRSAQIRQRDVTTLKRRLRLPIEQRLTIDRT